MNSAPRGRSGCSTGMPSCSATRFTGLGSRVERERPRGRSGWVTTPATSKPSPSRASSAGVANSGVPQKTIRIGVRYSLGASEFVAAVVSCYVRGRQRAAKGRELRLHTVPPGKGVPALEQAQVVNKEPAVQVIELVLQAAREQFGGIDLERIPFQVQPLHPNRCRTGDLAENLGNGQTAFLGLVASLGEHQFGIDERVAGTVNITYEH